jgi:beta-lactamase regulating signal transducer with metallopeptidase domain
MWTSMFPELHAPSIAATLHVAARHVLVPLIADYGARGTIVLVAGFGITALLRRRSAAARHTVWVVAVTAGGLMPLFARLVPSVTFDLPLLRSVSIPAMVTLDARSTVSTSVHALRSTRQPPHNGPLMVGEAGPAGPATSGRLAGSAVVWLALLWATGVLALVTRFIIGTIIVWRRAYGASPVVDPSWLTLVVEIARELRIRRPVTLLIGSANTIPVTWGVVYSVVLLPASALDWPVSRRRGVLLHELAHVARLDAATQLIAQLSLAANWFNPLAWVAVKRIRTERELACDDIVLMRGMRASSYADDVLLLVRTLQPFGGPACASLAMARQAELEGRLLALLDPHRAHTTMSHGACVASLAVAAPFIALLAAIRPSPAPMGTVAPPGTSSPTIALVTRADTSSSAPRASGMRQSRPDLAHATHHIAPPTAPLVTSPGASPVASTVTGLATGSPNRCPIHTDYLDGGVGADPGQLAAFEAGHGTHSILALATGGRCATVQIDGSVTLNLDASDVNQIMPGGSVTTIDTEGGHARRADVRSAAADGSPLYVIDGQILSPEDSLTRHYFVDGQERSWDEGRAWYAATLAELVRETAYDVRGRVVRLRNAGGVSAVLAEVRRMRNETGQHAYFAALLDTGPLSPDEAQQAADLAQSVLHTTDDRVSIVTRLRHPGS